VLEETFIGVVPLLIDFGLRVAKVAGFQINGIISGPAKGGDHLPRLGNRDDHIAASVAHPDGGHPLMDMKFGRGQAVEFGVLAGSCAEEVGRHLTAIRRFEFILGQKVHDPAIGRHAMEFWESGIFGDPAGGEEHRQMGAGRGSPKHPPLGIQSMLRAASLDPLTNPDQVVVGGGKGIRGRFPITWQNESDVESAQPWPEKRHRGLIARDPSATMNSKNERPQPLPRMSVDMDRPQFSQLGNRDLDLWIHCFQQKLRALMRHRLRGALIDAEQALHTNF